MALHSPLRHHDASASGATARCTTLPAPATICWPVTRSRWRGASGTPSACTAADASCLFRPWHNRQAVALETERIGPSRATKSSSKDSHSKHIDKTSQPGFTDGRNDKPPSAPWLHVPGRPATQGHSAGLPTTRPRSLEICAAGLECLHATSHALGCHTHTHNTATAFGWIQSPSASAAPFSPPPSAVDYGSTFSLPPRPPRTNHAPPPRLGDAVRAESTSTTSSPAWWGCMPTATRSRCRSGCFWSTHPKAAHLIVAFPLWKQAAR